MAIRTPRFTGQYNANDGRFSVPTSGVSSRVPTNTQNLRARNVLDLIGGIEKIGKDISDRYSATEYQNLTSEFEREKLNLFDDVTKNINNYNSFDKEGMKGHDALVKKYEKRAKELNINPDFMQKFKSFTLNSGDGFKNSLVRTARRIEPTILNNKAANLATTSITNLKGSHPDGSPASRQIRDELFLTLDRLAPVIGQEKANQYKRSYNQQAEKSFFETTFRENPGFFLEDDPNYQGFKFRYTDANDIESYKAKAKTQRRIIQNEIEKNRIKDTTAVTNALRTVSEQITKINVNSSLMQNPIREIPQIKEQIASSNTNIQNARKIVLSNSDLTDAKRISMLETLDKAEAGNLNRLEFISTLDILGEATNADDVTDIINEYVKTGKEREGHQLKEWSDNLNKRLSVFEKYKTRLEKRAENETKVIDLKNGKIDPNSREGKNVHSYALSKIKPNNNMFQTIQETNPSLVPKLSNMTYVQIVNNTLFREDTDGNGPGFSQLYHIAQETGHIPASTMNVYQNILTNQGITQEDYQQTGRALSQIIQLRNSNQIDDEDLKKYNLLDMYQVFSANIGTSPPFELGRRIQNYNDTRIKNISNFSPDYNDKLNGTIDGMFEPGTDGTTLAGTAVFDALVVEHGGWIDNAGLKIKKLMGVKSSVDGEDAEKRLSKVFSNDTSSLLLDPSVQRKMKSYLRNKINYFTKAEGDTAENAMKKAAKSFAKDYAPTLFNQSDFDFRMPDNPAFNESRDTGIEHSNKIANFIQKYYADNPVAFAPNYFDDAFVTAEITKKRQSFIFGDDDTYVIDALKLPFTNISIPFTGEKNLAYLNRIQTIKDSEDKFLMINNKEIDLKYAGKLNGNHSWQIFYKGIPLPSADGNDLLYIPGNNLANRQHQLQDKLRRRRKYGGKFINTITRSMFDIEAFGDPEVVSQQDRSNQNDPE